VKYRRVKKLDAKGQSVTVDEPYVDGTAYANALQLWCRCFETAPKAMRFLLGPDALAPEPEAPDLSPEQLEQLNSGVLPPGVTEAQLGALLMRGSKTEGEGGGT
jgi:hypothetical protein